MSYTKEQAKEKLAELIEKFKREQEAGKTKHFNEQQTKDYYIRPLFEYLNWNFEDSNEVTPEEKVSKGRVDYGFKIDEIPKFYVEAKSFKENLDSNIFTEQAINYARLKSVAWAILTNFERLKVFNAEWESTNPRDTIFIDLKCDEFLSKFDRIWSLSKDSFLKNELDREAEEVGKKIKKTPITPVMKQIFNDLMIWRDKLTKSISNYTSNSKIAKTSEELDEDVQRIIDRLIFIRVCEDRGIEKNTLQSKVREWFHSHKKPLVDVLNEIFREFDESYNSKLFAKHPSEDLKIDDSVLIDVINGLYESSDKVFKYDFSAIEVDVLGNIYEEYLGYILKKGKQKVGITESYLHRKKMGIYYTPTFVVDYIIKNSIDEMLKQMKPNEVDDIKVLDMACGSGSFLLKAFDALNDYHKSKNELDFLRKIKILTNNIYGVDLDPKSIEIAQLNLLLKTVEKRRLLPKLQNNLKVGNSLINDPEISDRSFKWNEEFKEILNNSGFDVIIGNPPYVESRDINNDDWDYFRKTYSGAYKRFDLSILFIEQAINLLKEGGIVGFIISNKFTASDYGYGIRKFILDNCSIKQIIDVSTINIFKDASTYPYIIILQKESDKSKREKNLIKICKVFNETDLKNLNDLHQISQKEFYSSPKLIFSLDLDANVIGLLEKINKDSVLLGDICEMKDGIHTGNIRDKIILSQKTGEKCKKLITAESIDRYSIQWNNLWVNYDSKVINKEKGEYGSFRSPRIFEASEKLVTALFGLRPEVAYDNEQFYTNNSIKVILRKNNDVDLKYILAILNSKLIMFYYKTFFSATHVRGGYIQFYPQDFLKLPVKNAPNNKHKKITELVNIILKLNKELQKINPESDKGLKLQEEINRIDKEIDSKVYELYGLTNEEIRIVENS